MNLLINLSKLNNFTLLDIKASIEDELSNERTTLYQLGIEFETSRIRMSRTHVTQIAKSANTIVNLEDSLVQVTEALEHLNTKVNIHLRKPE